MSHMMSDTQLVSWLRLVLIRMLPQERAELIADRLNPKLEMLQNNITLLICDTTAVVIIKAMFVDFPSIIEIINCSNKECEKHHPYERSVNYITFQTENGQIQGLQEFLIDLHLEPSSHPTHSSTFAYPMPLPYPVMD
ncbi:hypothetical protein ACI65C_004560 [Semiaphis heraclei]